MFVARCFSRRKNLKHLKFSNLNKCKYSSTNDCIHSRVPDINIPRHLIHEYVWINSKNWPDKVALECAETGRSYTFNEAYLKSRSFAVFLRESLRMEQKDTLAIIMPNLPEYVIAILGALTAGLKITLINPAFTPGEMAKQLLGSEAKVIVTITDLYEVVHKATISSKLEIIPIITVNHVQYQSTPKGTINFFEICDKDVRGVNLNVTVDYDDVAFLPYSSGTTGKPKGVELTHNNVIANIFQMNEPSFRLNEETSEHHQDIIPCVLPLFHIYGSVCITFNVFPQGCKLVMLPKFSSTNYIKLLEQYSPHILYTVPPIVLMLLNNENIKLRHLKNVRAIMSSAAPLGAADIERFHDKTLGKITILQMYGMTEASPLITLQSRNLTGGIKTGGGGLLLPNTKAKIVDIDDPSNKHLGLNVQGELIMKGPQIMKGYHKNEEATKEIIVDNGWLRTGDIAYFDEDGQIFLTDRLKELIKVKGFQVAPAELEELLRDHPNVVDAAVIGISHPDFGEVPRAFVVPRTGNVKPEHLEEYVASKVAMYKRLLGGVQFLNAIPRTASGKILRRELKAMNKK